MAKPGDLFDIMSPVDDKICWSKDHVRNSSNINSFFRPERIRLIQNRPQYMEIESSGSSVEEGMKRGSSKLYCEEGGVENADDTRIALANVLFIDRPEIKTIS